MGTGTKQKRSLVLGAGKSGLSALRFLQEKGYDVGLYDGATAEKEIHRKLKDEGIPVYMGVVPDFTKETFDFAVISPGIPPLEDSCACALTEHNIPIWGELELASRFIDKPIIGITGTNGKTTTTTLIGEFFKSAGYHTFVGGNIGIPLLESLKEDYDIYIVEMSSYQLETISTLKAKVAVYLNLTPDHLIRHGSMEGYLAAKANLCRYQDDTGFTVLNADDSWIASLVDTAKGRQVFFSQKQAVAFGSYVKEDGTIVFCDGNETPILNRNEIKIPGDHNLENALAAITAAKLLGLKNEPIAETLKTFGGVEHRMEDVAVIDGVRWVNDSKGTNPDSVFKALASYGDTQILLIAGGRNKGNSFDELATVIKEKCKALILIGEAADDMKASAEKVGMETVIMAGDMEHAVAAAKEYSESGDIVLLSPANASFDQFSCFEERGIVFKSLVEKLK